MNTKEFLAVFEARKRHTRHAAHLFMTVITCALWLPVWIFSDLRNCYHNNPIERNMRFIKMHEELALMRGATHVTWSELSSRMGYTMQMHFPDEAAP